ncbi:MAG: Gldg family protein, partial [Gammaproteobacteria bacterium]
MRRPQISDRLRFWLVNASFVVLFLAAVGLLQWLSHEFHLRFDWTQSARHTLSDASRAVLEKLDAPLTATAYVDNRGEVRRAVQEVISRYQRYKPDFTLEFVDADADPERVRTANVLPGGEVFFAYKGTT